MNVGPSSSRSRDGREENLRNLSSVFPQVETDVLQAVLNQEGTYEAAVEVLLLSVVSSSQNYAQMTYVQELFWPKKPQKGNRLLRE